MQIPGPSALSDTVKGGRWGQRQRPPELESSPVGFRLTNAGEPLTQAESWRLTSGLITTRLLAEGRWLVTVLPPVCLSALTLSELR